MNNMGRWILKSQRNLPRSHRKLAFQHRFILSEISKDSIYTEIVTTARLRAKINDNKTFNFFYKIFYTYTKTRSFA